MTGQPPRLPVGEATSGGFGSIARRVVRPDMSTTRKVLSVAWPVVITNLLQSLALTVDLIMVGTLGPVSLAATGVATQVFLVGMVIANGLAVGATALVARAIGAGDRDQAGRAVSVAILVALALSVPLMLATFYLDAPLLQLMGADSTIVAQGGLFLRVLAFGIPGNMLMLTATGAMQGAGDTRPGLLIGIAVNVVNLGLDYLLIFGNFGAPHMGLAGAAVATAVSYGAGGLAFLLILWRGKRPLSLGRGEWGRWLHESWRLLRIGAPAALEQLVLSLGFTAYLIIILNFHAEALAAHQIGIRVQSFAFMPGFGFAAAAAALTGQGLGRGDPEQAEADGWGAIALGVAIMLTLTIPIYIFAPELARLFTSDPEVLRLGTIWVRTIVIAMPAIGLHFGAAGALRGAGDTKWPLYVSFAGLWLVRIPLAWFLGITLDLQMIGIWTAYVIEYYGRALVTTWRFSRGRWKTIRI